MEVCESWMPCFSCQSLLLSTTVNNNEMLFNVFVIVKLMMS